jgi:uncharacterized protein
VTHPNEDLLRKGYNAFDAGNLETVLGLFADDIKWHVSGRSPLAGIYKGREEVLGFFEKLGELTEGTFRLEVQDVLANEGLGVVLTKELGQHAGRTLDVDTVHVWTIEEGKLTEFHDRPADQYASDAFFS